MKNFGEKVVLDKDQNRNSVIRVPMKPVSIYNCVTGKLLKYQPPDIEISKVDNKYLEKYNSLLT